MVPTNYVVLPKAVKVIRLNKIVVHSIQVGGQTPPAGMPQGTPVEERSALTKVMWFGILGFAGLVGGWVVTFLIFGSIFVTASNLNLPANATPAQAAAALGPIFQNFSLLLPSILVILLIGDVLLMMGFRDLAKVDNSKFSLPWKFMIVLIVGAVLVAGGIIPLFNDIPSIIAQAPTGPGTPSGAFFSAISTLLFAALIAGIGGIMAIVGIIGGQILGLWRLGSRYNSTIIKIGAIFTIIPFLNFVAPILILIGASQTKGRLSKPM
jgi:hypothetical protein